MSNNDRAPTMSDLLDRLDEMAAKATARPWYFKPLRTGIRPDGSPWEFEAHIVHGHPEDGHQQYSVINGAEEDEDLQFIVALANAYPALAKRLRAAQEVVDDAESLAEANFDGRTDSVAAARALRHIEAYRRAVAESEGE